MHIILAFAPTVFLCQLLYVRVWEVLVEAGIYKEGGSPVFPSPPSRVSRSAGSTSCLPFLPGEPKTWNPSAWPPFFAVIVQSCPLFSTPWTLPGLLCPWDFPSENIEVQFYQLNYLQHLSLSEFFGIVPDGTLQLLKEALPHLQINCSHFTTIPRPTFGNNKNQEIRGTKSRLSLGKPNCL
ncbi:hypothetical protein FD755_013559 [Muntiacus reevesi]|uniref:Uncharacterized protein n=1 Tax=Muntiacus reevesi TaxID=9886 RepID=A0A5N3XMC0_MUNRE|nr:hypothetical protein FD755_013559 [Muntiacus reevesi]